MNSPFGFKPGGNPPPRPKKNISIPLKKFLPTAIVLVLVIAIGSTCWYTVNEKQQAVVTTFGRVTGTTGAGIHFKLPFGIQQVETVDVNVYQKIEIGYRTDAREPSFSAPIEKESKMITGD